MPGIQDSALKDYVAGGRRLKGLQLVGYNIP
jgi:hypothetical protein